MGFVMRVACAIGILLAAVGEFIVITFAFCNFCSWYQCLTSADYLSPVVTFFVF